MTSPHRSEPTSQPPDGPNGRGADDPLGLSQLIASGVIDAVPGDPPVPMTVWRVADSTYGQHHGDGLTGRTAQLLVALYTRAGDTIVSATTPRSLARPAPAAAGTCRSTPRTGWPTSTTYTGRSG